MFFCSAGPISAQTVIEIGTGLITSVTGPSLIPVNSAVPYNSVDDTWTVAYAPWSQNANVPTPNANAFQPAAVSNGISVTNMCYLPSLTHPQAPGYRWISPNVDAQGRYIDAVFGNYFYKASFSACEQTQYCSQPRTIKSVTLNLDYIATDQDLIEIRINNYSIPGVNLGMSYNSPLSFFYTSNYSAVIPSNIINQSGPNTIVVVVNDPGDLCNNYYTDGIARSPTAINIKGTITIDYNLDFALKDRSGTIKNEFCLDEDFFLGLVGPNTAHNYLAQLFKMNGGVPTLIGAGNNLAFGNDPTMENVSALIRNSSSTAYSSYVFTPGDYRIYLNSGYNGCTQKIYKDFKLKCCNSPDATFNLRYSNGKLEGKGSSIGTHVWQIYSALNANAGPYTPVSTFSGPKFSMNSEGFCYFVKHTITVNGCGTACNAQSICNFSCEDKSCNLSAPAWIGYNSTSSVLSWAAVPGASSYIIQVIPNDPMCCNTNTSSVYISKYLTSTTTSRVLNQLTDLGYASKPFCFSWRVYAVCADGTPSNPSNFRCSNALPGTLRTTGAETTDVEKEAPVHENTTLAIFPNPANGLVTIDVSSVGEVAFDIEMFDGTGKIVKTLRDQKTTGKRASVKCDVEDLKKGVYLVKISSSDGAMNTQKLIIE